MVAYRQPCTRGDVERVRGVDSDYVIRSLMHRRLVVEVGRRDTPGRPGAVRHDVHVPRALRPDLDRGPAAAVQRRGPADRPRRSQPRPMASERLQKLIARAGLASRRGAEVLIADGRVSVNGSGAHDRRLGRPAPRPDRGRRPAAGRRRPGHPPRRPQAARLPQLGPSTSAAAARSCRWSTPAASASGRPDAWTSSPRADDPDQRRRVGEPRAAPALRQRARVRRARGARHRPRDAGAPPLGRAAGGRAGPAAHRPPRCRRRPRWRGSETRTGAWLRVRIGEGRKREVRRLFAAVDARACAGWSARASAA